MLSITCWNWKSLLSTNPDVEIKRLDLVNPVVVFIPAVECSASVNVR